MPDKLEIATQFCPLWNCGQYQYIMRQIAALEAELATWNRVLDRHTTDADAPHGAEPDRAGAKTMTAIKPNDRVTAYGRNGTVIRLARDHRTDGAEVRFDNQQFTEFYSLGALTRVSSKGKLHYVEGVGTVLYVDGR